MKIDIDKIEKISMMEPCRLRISGSPSKSRPPNAWLADTFGHLEHLPQESAPYAGKCSKWKKAGKWPKMPQVDLRVSQGVSGGRVPFLGILGQKKPFLALVAILFSTLAAFPALADTGYATYYTAKSCRREGTSGVWTASGERYDERALTCALPHHRFGGRYRVQSRKTGRVVVVRHSDYGPSRKCQLNGTVVDLTPHAFMALGHSLREGKILVEITEVR